MITVSNAAAKKVIDNLARRGKGIGIRVGIKTTGCSGMAYTLEYVDNYIAEPNITNFGQEKFVLLVDNKSLVYMDGMEIDYAKQGLNEGFEFKNPNAKDHCGCGESFRV